LLAADKLKFYIENIKVPSLHCFYDIYSSVMCQVVTYLSENLATFSILSEQVSQYCYVLIKIPTLVLRTYNSSFVFKEVLGSDLSQGAGHVD